MRLKKSLPVLLSLIVINAYAQIQIIENSSKRYSFNWEMNEFKIDTITQDNRRILSISFDGENTVFGESEEACLPGYSFVLGVPPQGQVSLNFNAEEYKTVSLGLPVEKHSVLQMKRHPELVFDQVWISSPVYKKLQGIKTAHFAVRPFVYDKNSNTLKVLVKGSCTVEYPSYPHNITTGNETTGKKQMIRTVLSNYQIANGWKVTKSLSKRAADNSFPLKSDQKRYRFQIGDISDINNVNEMTTNEMTTKENGILKIPGDSVIKYLNLSSASIDNVVLYASIKGELNVNLDDTNEIPSGLVEIPLLRIDRNRNTRVDSDDMFLAFVTGASDWGFESPDYKYKLDRYDDYRNYWLTVSNSKGKTIPFDSCGFVSIDTLTGVSGTFINRIIFGQNAKQTEDYEGGLDWYWKELETGNSDICPLDLPGLDTLAEGTVKINFTPRKSGNVYLSVDSMVTEKNGVYKTDRWKSTALIYNAQGYSDAYAEIKNIEVQYRRHLTIGDGQKLEIHSPSDSIFNYRLSITTNELIYLFKIPTDEEKITLMHTLSNAANKYFIWSDTGGRGTRYFACTEQALTLLPEQINQQTASVNSSFLVKDIRNTSNTTDYLIISAPEFIKAADKLSNHKLKMGFNAPRIVNVKDIYDAFSGGDVDPTAIRNFVAYVQNYWNASSNLDYVILFGNGHYDYKKVKSIKPIYIPVFYSDNRLYEDYYVRRNGVDQACIGRMTCENEVEANAIVEKIIETEDPQRADFSDWRNRALFVADDDKQGTTYDNIAHHSQSDRIASMVENMWPSINMRKIYLYEYKWNTALQKPEASKAILNEIGNGVAYVNYFGHGSEDQWAQEKVLLPEHIRTMNNPGKYPVISSFSCSVGKFDHLTKDCISSLLIKKEKAGAIIAISSTRIAYASTNERIAENFYNGVFNRDTLYSIGEAFYRAKKDIGDYGRTYALLGDPSITVLKPSHSINMKILGKNGVEIDSSMMALQQITVTGAIINNNGQIDNSFGTSSEPAFVQIGLFNPQEETSRKDGGENISIRYFLPGKTIFMGSTQVINGTFNQTIQLPGNLSFNKTGAKLTGYAWKDGNKSAATGYKTGFIFNGTDTSVSISNDSSGPVISISPIYDYDYMSSNKASFSGQILKLDSLKLEVDVYDQSGLDVIGVGPDQGLTMEIKGVTQQQNINHKFHFNAGDYRRGSALIKDYVLKPGTYSLNFTAQDLRGNLSKESFQVEITEPQKIEFGKVFNSPNPFRMGKGTRFYFFPNKTSIEAFAAVKIYTLSGKPVRVIKNAVNGQFWDGRDQAGSVLSPDIYLYQVEAYAEESFYQDGSVTKKSKKIKSKICKLVINP